MTQLIQQTQTLIDTLKTYHGQYRIALVPTMGNLHAGHLSLVELAKQHADKVIVSVFVNPTQFSIHEDFDHYPRTLEDDFIKLNQAGVDLVFAPTIEQMYPKLPSPTQIHMGALAEKLCGQSRPHHFDGVGLIVSKLFNLIRPNVAIFGKKDYQQLCLIHQLVRDLSYPIDIIGAPIGRAPDGLALSSRNQYLTEKERAIAPQLHETLAELAEKLTRGEHCILGFAPLIKKASQKLIAVGFEIDYLVIKTPDLNPANEQDKQLIILAAAWLGKARLLDNQEVTVTS